MKKIDEEIREEINEKKNGKQREEAWMKEKCW